MNKESTKDLEQEFIDALNLLKECSTLFRRYERNHMEKASAATSMSGTNSHVEKAEVNKDIAERIEKFLTKGMSIDNDDLIESNQGNNSANAATTG
jgi:hypothetical protein